MPTAHEERDTDDVEHDEEGDGCLRRRPERSAKRQEAGRDERACRFRSISRLLVGEIGRGKTPDLVSHYGSSVPAFTTDDVLGNRLDFEIARDGFVRRLRDDAVLRDAETWFRREGYRVTELNAGAWNDDKQMHAAFATGLQFPGHFGNNLDALDDCMSNVAEADHGWDASETGLVLILSGFDRFAQRLPRTADHVQDILRRQGRYAALFGNRLLTILS
ncbi:hypothetical protein GCM10009627_17950 [Curtobacterium herbarum]|uniref:Barstar (barnase inhibitor) domain-containing protein n=1 Tax=Curtobacterium herbarum TaxID=150122 RepID=A0ABP4K5I6_9MICO